jgi:hypothetical protein
VNCDLSVSLLLLLLSSLQKTAILQSSTPREEDFLEYSPLSG